MDILLLLAILPSFFLGKYIYNMDIVEKEPKKLLTGLFFAGVGIIIPAVFLETLFSFGDESTNPLLILINCFLFVALIEEGLKWIVLKAITWKNENFTHIYDAIVYAVFVSLGFATLENILYCTQMGFVVAIVRAIFSVPGHAFFGVFMGYYYGMAKQAETNKNNSLTKKNLFLSFIVPVVLHGIFDFCLLVNNIFAVLFYLVFVVLLYVFAFKKIKQFSKINRSFKNEISDTNQVSSKNETSNISQTSSKQVRNFCPYCGKEAKGNFCTNCGKDLRNLF